MQPSRVAVFTLTVISIAVILTWSSTTHGGSLLLAMLAHSSVKTAQLVMVNELFPSAASTEVNALLGSAGVALVLIMMTRGRLGYRGGEVVVLPVIAPDVGSACPEDRP